MRGMEQFVNKGEKDLITTILLQLMTGCCKVLSGPGDMHGSPTPAVSHLTALATHLLIDITFKY